MPTPLYQVRVSKETARRLKRLAFDWRASETQVVEALMAAYVEGRASAQAEQDKSDVVSVRVSPLLRKRFEDMCQKQGEKPARIMRALLEQLAEGRLEVSGAFLPNPFPKKD